MRNRPEDENGPGTGRRQQWMLLSLCSKGHIDLRTSLTYGFPSPKQSSRCGRTWTTYGSKSFPSMLHSISKANSAPGGHKQPSIHHKYSMTQITFPTTASIKNIPALMCSNQPTFPSPEVLLVLDGVRQRGHDFLLFKGQDSESFDQPGQTVGCPLPLRVLVTLQQQLQQVPHNPCSIFFNGWDQRRQTAGYRLLNLGREGRRDGGKEGGTRSIDLSQSGFKVKLFSSSSLVVKVLRGP